MCHDVYDDNDNYSWRVKYYYRLRPHWEYVLTVVGIPLILILVYLCLAAGN